MKTLGLIVVCLVLVCSCASKAKRSQGPKCLDEKYAQQTLEAVSLTIDAVAKMDGIRPSDEKPKLIEDRCYKRIYVKADQRILLSSSITDPGGVTGTMKPLSQVITPEASLKCLRRAEAAAQEINFEAGLRVLKNYKVRHPEFYEDSDIGPAKWLACNAGDHSFWDSIELMAHEVAHDLRQKECLMPAVGEEALCFYLSNKLPNRSLGKIAKMPTDIAVERTFLENLQKLYLTDLDQPPLILFDEVNAYAITTLGFVASLKTNGQKYFVSSSGSRGAVLLPAFLVMTANYLIRLKDSQPSLYKENFVSNQNNRASLLRLLTNAENAFQNWEQIRKAQGMANMDYEDNFWRQYLTLRQKLAMAR